MADGGPFRGLRPYDENARDAFFGRATEREALTQMVLGERYRMGLVTGMPGVGKTSLVRAGLIPQLSQRGALAVYLTDYLDFEGDLGRALARAGAPASAAAPPGKEGGDAAVLLSELAATQPLGAV